MNKILISLILLVLLSHCSLNENSRIWKNKENKLETSKNIKKVFVEEKRSVSEFNQGLKLDLSKITSSNIINDNLNYYGPQDYNGRFNKIASFKFSKLDEINQLNFKPVFLKDGIVFFDKKGSIIRYDNNQKIIWKQNNYSKAEKKLGPKLKFILDNQNLLVADSIAKYYSINLKTGKLNWKKSNTYPFNSEIKKHKDKIFVVDYKNTLRCYFILDGNECWNTQTEDTFTISLSKFSLIIINEKVIFLNSIGDITAVDIETGLIVWQLPTQSSDIINESYNFKTSKIVSDGKSLYFSNNKDEFYSIDLKTGTINWITNINSNVTPRLIGNLILTISNDGYFYIIDKNKGNIIRITNLYNHYKEKKRKNINPVGFVIGKNNLYLTNSDGKIIIVGISLGNTVKIEKISSDFISEPFIFNKNLYVVRNGSIIKYD